MIQPSLMAIGDTQRDKVNVFPSDKRKKAVSQGVLILTEGYNSQRDYLMSTISKLV